MADTLNQPNYAHLYPGWGLNPNYNTPAYDAPYRPKTSSANPYANYGPGPSVGGALNHLYNPFVTDPYWGSVNDNTQHAAHAAMYKSADASVHVLQNYVAPTLMFGLATKMFSNMGAKIGAGVASGLATGLGAGGVAGAAGAIGAFGGSVLLPLGVGMAASSMVNSVVFDPYIHQRAIANSLSQNFAARYMGPGFGGTLTGRGMGAGAAASIGARINSQGISDMTFSMSEYAGMADMGMRAGLFDDVGGDGIVKRVKSIAAQVKAIMAISKDGSFQAAIEELAKLKMGGASLVGGVNSQAARAYSQIGFDASIAGVAIQKLGEIRNQGNYMYRASGLTPYLGELAAASGYAGFSQAQQNGLISQAHLARMGGLEGATQSYMGALVSGSRTNINRIGLMAEYRTGRSSNSLVQTARDYGAAAARDPLGMIGSHVLYDDALASRKLSADDGKSLEMEAEAILRNSRVAPLGKNGKYSETQLAGVMSQSMGISKQEIQAYIAQRTNDTNPDQAAKALSIVDHEARALVDQSIIQSGQGAGPGGELISFIRKVGKGFQEAGNAVGELIGYGAAITQGIGEEISYAWQMGGTVERNSKFSSKEQMATIAKAGNIGELRLMGQAQAVYSRLGSVETRKHREAIEELLNKPEFKSLKDSLKGLSSKEKIDKIRDIASKSTGAGLYRSAKLAADGKLSYKEILQANGGKLTGDDAYNWDRDLDPEAFATITSSFEAAASKNASRISKSTSNIDYSNHTSIMQEIDGQNAETQKRAASMNLDAAIMNRDTARMLASGVPSSSSLSGGITKRQ